MTRRSCRKRSGLSRPPCAGCVLLHTVALTVTLLSPALRGGTHSLTAAFVPRAGPPASTRARLPPRTASTLPRRTRRRMSSVGGGSEGDGKNSDDNPLNEWMQRKDSDNVRRLREQMAEGRLPISYGALNAEDEGDDDTIERFGPLGGDDAGAGAAPSAALSRVDGARSNPYLKVVSGLAPSDLIAKFTASASPRVQEAVRTTILGLIGGLPQLAFSTKTVATGERLASLMFQLQMTGYMFKNAEYRASLSQELGAERGLPGGAAEKEYRDGVRVKGRIKVRYGRGGSEEVSAESLDADGGDGEAGVASTVSSPGMELEVDAQAYMSELRGEVSRLRDELEATKQAKEEVIRKDLLLYIRTLPQQELQQLTGTMSPEVLEAMKGLVTAVLAGIGEDGEGGDDGAGPADDNPKNIGLTTVTEQSGEALAQLCMWQLVVGFNLRELEVRDELRSSMRKAMGDGGGLGDNGGSDADGVQFGPGSLE